MLLTKKPTQGQYLAITIGILVALGFVLFANAWIVDDAYITFRAVDNFVHGYGPTWNPDERVQVYTHPFWMLVVSFFFFFTSEFFFTVILLSFVLTMSSVLIVWMAATHGFRMSRWKGPLLVLSLLSSKAFVDYASSGLENSMSYLIAAIFLYQFLSLRADQEVSPKKITTLFFLSSLAFLNRADTILLYLPSLLYLLYLLRSMSNWHLGRLVIIATLPSTLWVLFSLIYYGYPFPNTAYAKVLCTGFPLAWKIQRGLEYLSNSIFWDTASYVIFAGAVWLSYKRRSPVTISVMAGVTLYVLFVVCSGASATHMSGRFFAVPLFMAIFLFVDGIQNSRFGLVVCICLAAYIAWSPVSAVKFGTAAYRAYPQNHNYIDTKWYVSNEGAALINWRPGKKMPDHAWYHYGEELRQRPEKVHIGGAFGGVAIGYAAFAAGPKVHFIDKVGLSDPLLSRLPARQPNHISQWKSGHFHRHIPLGYVDSLVMGKNLLHDPNMRRYYDFVRTITRGPVLGWERFKVVFMMNSGQYRYLLAAEEQKN